MGSRKFSRSFRRKSVKKHGIRAILLEACGEPGAVGDMHLAVLNNLSATVARQQYMETVMATFLQPEATSSDDDAANPVDARIWKLQRWRNCCDDTPCQRTRAGTMDSLLRHVRRPANDAALARRLAHHRLSAPPFAQRDDSPPPPPKPKPKSRLFAPKPPTQSSSSPPNGWNICKAVRCWRSGSSASVSDSATQTDDSPRTISLKRRKLSRAPPY